VSQLAESPAIVAAPKLITISDNRGYMRFTYADGGDIELNAERMRAACKCAHCTRARIDGFFPDRFDGVTIEQFSFMGGYAINIAFSDGHARGIYPWAFLIGLSDAVS
jgi:prepilin-type processing-associated H-X9-DG protein